MFVPSGLLIIDLDPNFCVACSNATEFEERPKEARAYLINCKMVRTRGKSFQRKSSIQVLDTLQNMCNDPENAWASVLNSIFTVFNVFHKNEKSHGVISGDLAGDTWVHIFLSTSLGNLSVSFLLIQ